MDYWDIYRSDRILPVIRVKERPNMDIIRLLQELNQINPMVQYRAEPKNLEVKTIE